MCVCTYRSYRGWGPYSATNQWKFHDYVMNPQKETWLATNNIVESVLYKYNVLLYLQDAPLLAAGLLRCSWAKTHMAVNNGLSITL